MDLWITILESCSTSANALRMSLSKSMAFCHALWATVTSPSQPGPPHFLCPAAVRQCSPPHSDSAQEAPTGVPHIWEWDKGSDHSLIFIAELWGGWHPKYHSTTWDVWPSLWVPPNLGYSMIANDAEAEQTVPASGPYQHDGSPSITFPQLPAFNLIATSQLPAAGVAWGQLCLHCLLFLTVSFTRKLPLGSGLQAGSYYCLYSFCWKPVLLLLEETLANPSSFFKKEEYVLHKISSFPLLPGGEQRKTNKILNRKLLHLSWKTVPFPSIECLFCHTAFQFVTMKSEETNFVAAFFLSKTTLIGNFYWAYPLLWSTGQWNH